MIIKHGEGKILAAIKSCVKGRIFDKDLCVDCEHYAECTQQQQEKDAKQPTE